MGEVFLQNSVLTSGISMQKFTLWSVALISAQSNFSFVQHCFLLETLPVCSGPWRSTTPSS